MHKECQAVGQGEYLQLGRINLVTHGSVCRYIISSETYAGALILVAFPGQQNTPMGT